MGDLTPNTREEYFLARMAGEDVTMPEPITREEEYMKGIAAQIEAGSAELPAVTDVDEGKILAVNANGKWDKADAPTELPAVTDVDEGKLLSVNANGEWDKVDAPPSAPLKTMASKKVLADITTTETQIFGEGKNDEWANGIFLINITSTSLNVLTVMMASSGVFSFTEIAKKGTDELTFTASYVVAPGYGPSFALNAKTDSRTLLASMTNINIYKLG